MSNGPRTRVPYDGSLPNRPVLGYGIAEASGPQGPGVFVECGASLLLDLVEGASVDVFGDEVVVDRIHWRRLGAIGPQLKELRVGLVGVSNAKVDGPHA